MRPSVDPFIRVQTKLVSMAYTVAVAGASGYAGGELLRILAAHPDFDVRTVTAHSNAGQLLSDVHPHLNQWPDLVLQDTTAEVLSGHDVVFVALPHGKSGELTDALGDEALVIDVAADHRLEREEDWNEFYGSQWYGTWTYGMPELLLGGLPSAGGTKQRDRLAGARRIAVPGCNVTAVTFALMPALAAGLVEAEDLVAVLAVGVSGAGKALKPHLLASEILGSAAPYSVAGTHRHIPEIRQNLRNATGLDTTLSMTPVLVPMSRGILATSTARLKPGVTIEQLRAAYDEAYGTEAAVQLLPAGQFPKSADTVGANLAQIGIAIDKAANRLVSICALDNLVKGTAGAAVQSANLALGLPEYTGLNRNGVAP